MSASTPGRAHRRYSGRPIIGLRPPLPPGIWLRPATDPLPFPLDEPARPFASSARQALASGLRARGACEGDEVLMPAWHGKAQRERLDGMRVALRFFSSAPRTAPDQDELERLVGPRTRALWLIHHLGFPEDAARWRSWCEAHGILLVEDASQAWGATSAGAPVGSAGHLAAFCLRNAFGLAGAVLAPDVAPAAPVPRPGDEVVALAGGHLRWLAERWSLTRATPRTGRCGAARGERLTDQALLAALRRLAPGDVAAARRANYRLLLGELSDRVPEPFASLPDGAAPLVLPVRADDGDDLRRRLAARGVAAIPLPFGPDAATVGLPVHQELSIRDLDRIADAAARRPRRGASLRVEPVDRLEDLEAEWDELARRSGNVFATREWVVTWWRHFGAGRPLRLLACREAGGRLVAIVPAFESTTRPVRTLRFIGHALGDRLGPICSPADVGRTARTILRALEDGTLGGDVLVGEELAGEERWGPLLGAATLRREGSPVLDLPAGGFDQWLASRSRNFRDQVRRRERKLAREHALAYRRCDSAAALERDLQVLFDLHSARWGEESEAFAESRRAFHREFSELALRQGWLQLWIMELDGAPVAAWHGFRFGNSEWYYQAGRDPAYEASAVGFVLLSHTIREAAAAGVRTYRLGRGGEDYKRRFSSRDPGLETIIASRGARGALSRGAAATAAALPREWRRRAARLAG